LIYTQTEKRRFPLAECLEETPLLGFGLPCAKQLSNGFAHGFIQKARQAPDR
jgi:hypothetical protein